MTDIVERLRDPLIWPDMAVLTREAADEIERLRTLLAASEHYTSVQTKLRDDEIERLEGLLKAKVTPGYELLADQIEKRDAEIERLTIALEIIAGRRQCLDNLMGNVDVACAALDGGKR